MACSLLSALCSDVHHPGRSRANGHAGRRVAHIRRRSGQHALRPARSNQRRELQQAAGRLAIQDGCLRRPPGLQPSDDAADDQRRALRHGRIEAGRRGHRRGDRRTAVDVPDRRGQARGGGAAPAVGPRCGVLDRWKRRRAHFHGDVRVSARRARSEDRAFRSARSARTASSISSRTTTRCSIRSPARLV